MDMPEVKEKYQAISKKIESDIESRLWEDRLPGVALIAEHYGVATRTAHKAVKHLASKGRVTIRGTQGTFISSQPNPRKRMGMIGLIGAPGSQSVDAIRLARTYAERHRSDVVVLGTRQDLKDTAPTFFSHLPVDGLVFLNSTITPDIVAELRRKAMPFVSANRLFHIDGLDWVDYDNPDALRQAVMFLHTRGHRRIAAAGFAMPLPGHEDELQQTYHDIMAEIGLDDAGLWFFDGQSDLYHQRHGDSYMTVYGRRVADELLGMDNPPTAIVVTQPAGITTGIVEQAEQLGLHLPGDLAVVAPAESLDDDFDRHLLARLELPHALRLETALRQLFARIEQPDLPPQQELLKATLKPVTPPARPRATVAQSNT